MEKKLKLYTTKIKSIDESKKAIRFQVSDDSIDRYGEKVDQGWNVKNFLKNPIALWNHRSGYEMQPEDVMGNWGDFETKDGKTFATLTFDGENPKAEFVYGQCVRGFLRAVSVGFSPHSFEFDDDTPVLKDNELLEISPVGVPANANALALSLKDGSLNRKDAQWMIRSMTEATASLEEQLNENALVAMLADVQYKGENAFANMTDNTASDFATYPVLHVLPNFIENTEGAMSQNDRDVNLQAVVSRPLEDPEHIQASVIDQIYDLTDLILDTLDQGDFDDRLKTTDPAIGSFILEADRADWDVVDTKGGVQLMLVAGITVSYELDLELR